MSQLGQVRRCRPHLPSVRCSTDSGHIVAPPRTGAWGHERTSIWPRVDTHRSCERIEPPRATRRCGECEAVAAGNASLRIASRINMGLERHAAHARAGALPRAPRIPLPALSPPEAWPPVPGRKPHQRQVCYFTLALILSRPALAQASSCVPPP
jgi:hypothetical protein